MSTHDDRLATMTPDEQRALLSAVLSAGATAAVTNLSPQQLRLWFLRQLDASVPWHAHAAVRLRGPLDLAVLQQALADLVGRVDILRITIESINGLPVQSVAASAPLTIRVLDSPPEVLDQTVRQQVNQPFELRTGPLIRAAVVRIRPEEHVLLLVAHELVADQPSVRSLMVDLLCCYGGERVAPARPFAEYAQRQAAWLDGETARGHLEWWRDELAEVPSLRIATNRRRPLDKTFRAVTTVRDIVDPVRAAIDRFAVESNASPEALLLAAYTMLLARHSGQRDFAIGIPDRDGLGVDTERVIGPIEDLLPIRLRMSVEQPFADWLRVVVERLADGRSRAGIPFTRVVEAVNPPRDLTQTPLCQAAFAMAIPPPPELALLRPEWVQIDTGHVTHDLELTADRTEGLLSLRLTGNADLFDRRDLDLMLERLGQVLAEVTENPRQPLRAFTQLTADERRRALVEWNDTTDDHDRHTLFHELVGEQAKATPDALAVRCGDVDLTYGQLDRAAEHVAVALRTLGAGPDRTVALVADRSADTVVGLLGILKAGAAYVPVARNAPAERLRFALTDANVMALVEGRPFTGVAARAGNPLPVVSVPDATTLTDQPAAPVGPVATAANLAYVIYTSGSTGQPKGVAVEHRQLLASTAARWAYPDPEVDLLTLPLTFDAAAGGLHWTLTRGGTVVIPTEDEAYDPRLIAKLVRRQRITHINSMHAHYKFVLDATHSQDLADLRFVDVGGEPLPPALVAEHYRRTPEAVLCNCYGPTETTIWAASYDTTAQDAGTDAIPIGRPVRNTRIYLLDDDMEIVPPGVPGELYIGGEGVSRGYLRPPVSTAERFLPDPFDRRPGARMYRTGDRARYRTDGAIEFLGRSDNQVKIRGFRVELGEIESAVTDHPAVGRSAVILHDDGLRRRLIAYLTPEPGQSIDVDDVRSHVLRKVPDYMVPAIFIVLDEMPVTASGKVDRHALPSPTAPTNRAYIAPRTATEHVVAEIVAELLGTEKVSVTTDFFELGGDSLLLARLMSKLSRRYDITVALDQIFRVATVAGIAHAIENQQRRDEDDVDAGAMLAVQLADLRAELELDRSVRPDGLPRADWLDPGHVLVTGATGYIGGFIVDELMRRTTATVHCLVRATDDASAMSRLVESLRGYQIYDEEWQRRYGGRLRPIAGDLALPRLGLSEQTYTALAGQIDAIYHSGATVNFVNSYESLKAANVDGTVELLRLATTTRLKAMHHISTMDVFIGTHAPRPFLEEDIDERPKLLPTSYARSKWVSEKLVSRAAERGVPVCIYRPWLVMGHRRTGVSHTTDYLLVALKGFLELQLFPTYNDVINAIPVDVLAEAVVTISQREDSFRRVYYHIGNLHPAPMLDIYHWVNTFGYETPLIDYEAARRQALLVDQESPLFAMAPIMAPASMSQPSLKPDAYQSIDPTVEYRNYDEATAHAPIDCPPVDEQYVHRVLQYLVDTGFLRQPEAASAMTAS